MNRILQVLDEDANKIINNLKTEINNFSSIKSILNLVYAKCLVDYQNTNSYLLYSRTNTVSFDDFNMDIERLFGTNRSCFRKTLLDEAILKQTYLSNYLLFFDYSDEEKTKKKTICLTI
jgi:hypothetical protein